ncbi:MAG: hypothetical protein A3E87_04015 [Gammaproteobacteria bacterium RIFCSPHIGHO2_12_FULL_35_23]|nr:MAG: hypothetical protein A3E87_04015 [Gammaproteobacteria bacterium RIFCSPHIGHO2_12_FULL_35_23]
MAKINRARFAVLGMLTSGAASGYDIKKAMSQSTDHFWRESDGSIYPIINQVLKEKLVSCKSQNLKSNKPKKVYSITPAGRRVLESWLTDDALLIQNRDELLLKIFFGWNVDPKVTIQRLEKFQYAVKNRVEAYKVLTEKFEEAKASKESLYHFLTLKAGLYALESRLKWGKEALKILGHKVK